MHGIPENYNTEKITAFILQDRFLQPLISNCTMKQFTFDAIFMNNFSKRFNLYIV